MGRRKRSPEEQERREKIRELLQLSGVSSMEDIQDLFKETIAEFMEDGLEAELSEELGYSKYDYKNKDTDDIVGCTSRHETGTAMAHPGLAEITNAALRGEMDILLVLNASRLGRDIRNTLEFVDWLEKHTVEVVCLNGDFSIRGVGQLLLAKQTVM